ncbi:MAG: hypothetical protein INR73_10955 [Williamsia sp.]|nr:hypothetical protein [Williamsia sp.]
MPSNFQVNIQLKGKETVADVNRTTDDFPLHYTVNFSPAASNAEAGDKETEIVFYGTIPGPYDDPDTPQSQAYFQQNSINDPETETALAKAIVDHEKHTYPTLVPEA